MRGAVCSCCPGDSGHWQQLHLMVRTLRPVGSVTKSSAFAGSARITRGAAMAAAPPKMIPRLVLASAAELARGLLAAASTPSTMPTPTVTWHWLCAEAATGCLEDVRELKAPRKGAAGLPAVRHGPVVCDATRILATECSIIENYCQLSGTHMSLTTLLYVAMLRTRRDVFRHALCDR